MAKTRKPVTRKVKEALSDLPTSFTSPESSLIAGATYDPKSWDLHVRFQRTRETSDTYAYQHISPAVWRGFVEAKSKGVYFNQHVRPLAPGKMVKPQQETSAV